MPDLERLQSDTLTACFSDMDSGLWSDKRRVLYYSCVKGASVSLELERESVLGAYCLRASGKRKGDVFRRRQVEQEWG